ncbi:hypothetical protein SLE2022_315430 [Rubroshorea leprosula]
MSTILGSFCLRYSLLRNQLTAFKEGSSLNEFASTMIADDQALNHIIDPRLFKNISDGSSMQSLSTTFSFSGRSSNRTNHSYRMEKCEEWFGNSNKSWFGLCSTKCNRSFIHQRGPGIVTTKFEISAPLLKTGMQNWCCNHNSTIMVMGTLNCNKLYCLAINL